jgi:TolB-like protein
VKWGRKTKDGLVDFVVDNMLAEFSIALDAVQCADQFHHALDEFNQSALVQIPSLFLISDNTAFSIRTKPMSIPEIGCKFGVQYVLEGGVRRPGKRLQILARLSETEQGRQIWG